jgi:hypothetical protein
MANHGQDTLFGAFHPRAHQVLPHHHAQPRLANVISKNRAGQEGSGIQRALPEVTQTGLGESGT